MRFTVFPWFSMAPFLAVVVTTSWLPGQRTIALLEPGFSAGRLTALSPETIGMALPYRFPQDASFALMSDPYSGKGVCVGDVDGDGDPDVFLTHYPQGNRLYRSPGDWRFENVAEAVGVRGGGVWCAGTSFADIDHDGDLNLHVCVFDGPNGCLTRETPNPAEKVWPFGSA